MEEKSKVIVVGVVSSIIFLAIFAIAIVMIIINYQHRKKNLADQKKALETIFQNELLEAKLEIQEDIFKKVSQEIHDNVGHLLSVAKLKLNIINLNGLNDHKIAEVVSLIGNAIRELRDISSGYFADKLFEKGLICAVSQELEILEKTGLFSTSLKTNFDYLTIDNTKAIFLYRIFQEICNNIIKHSKATKVDVVINKENENAEMIISDNGCGYNEDDLNFVSGLGLNSIRKRTEVIGASIVIKSTIGKGTIIHLTFKLDNV